MSLVPISNKKADGLLGALELDHLMIESFGSGDNDILIVNSSAGILFKYQDLRHRRINLTMNLTRVLVFFRKRYVEKMPAIFDSRLDFRFVLIVTDGLSVNKLAARTLT